MAGLGAASAGNTTRSASGLRGATAAALLLAMMSLSACGTWADPTQLFADDEEEAPPTAATVNSGSAPNSDRFPNLARVPPRPVETSTTGDRSRAVDSLAADRSNARHTDEELRARPADSATPPPAPRAPVTQLPASAPAPQPRGAVQPTSPGVTQQQQQAAQPGAAPMAQPRAANVTDSFSQNLAQSSANSLPAGLAQGQAGGGGYNGVPLPGSTQLLAIVRFNNNESALGNDDKALVNKVAEYFKGVGGKGTIRVTSFAPQGQSALAQRRGELVSAELRRRGIPMTQIQLNSQTASATPAYYETAGRASDQGRRVEIYIVN